MRWLFWGYFRDALSWLSIDLVCYSGTGSALLEWRSSHWPQPSCKKAPA